MTLQECYIAFGGNEREVLQRLPNERLVRKYLFRFLEDKSFDLLKLSMKNQDYIEAFRASHTLKGLSQNLGFSHLERSSSILCEALRQKDIEKVSDLFNQVESDYIEVFEAISEFKKES